MTDFDKVTISRGGNELIALEPNLEEHGDAIGGAILCLDTLGNVRIRLEAASAQFGGSSVLVRGGACQIVNAGGAFRAILHSGDQSTEQDGGALELIASTDSVNPMPDGIAPPRAIVLNASERSLVIRNKNGHSMVNLGGGQTGDLYLRNEAGVFTVALRAVENDVAGIWVGGHGQKGLLILRNTAGKNIVDLGSGESGDLYLRNSKGQFTVALRAVENDVAGIWVGGHGQHGLMILRDKDGSNRISLDAKTGDIVLENADCAEEFDVAALDEATPGTVMVIAEEGRLRPSTTPYDRRVAGIVSGMGKQRPGIVLGRSPENASRVAIALVGRAVCKVTAETEAIAIGDLLTSSPVRGHAMKATDATRALGTIIGKALAPLASGRGAIPALIALQ